MDEDHSDSGFLDTGEADKSVWLMKCPVVVAKSWKSQAASSFDDDDDDSQPVANVVLSLDLLKSDHPSSLQVAMEGNFEHNMTWNHMRKTWRNMGGCVVKGQKIHDQEQTNTGRLVIDNDCGVHVRPLAGIVDLISSNPKDKKKTTPVKQSDMKKIRRDHGELEDIMFKLFERQPNWAVKQLVQETDQPAQFLKVRQNELYNYNKRGTNERTFELKPESRKSVEDTEAE